MKKVLRIWNSLLNFIYVRIHILTYIYMGHWQSILLLLYLIKITIYSLKFQRIHMTSIGKEQIMNNWNLFLIQFTVYS